MSAYEDLMESNPELFANEDAIIEVVTDRRAIADWTAQTKERLRAQGLPPQRAQIGVIYEDSYVVIVRDLVRFESGAHESYLRLLNRADLNGGRGSVVLPVLGDSILLMRQFRHPTRGWHREIPRGFGQPNLSAAENARKEIREEVQGEVSELIDLGPYHSNTGIESTCVQLFLAHLESVGDSNLDEGIASYEFVSVEEFGKLIGDGEITDGFTIAAYTRARLRGHLGPYAGR